MYSHNIRKSKHTQIHNMRKEIKVNFLVHVFIEQLN